MPHRIRLAGLTVAATGLTLIAAGLTACSASPAPKLAITVSRGACGSTWHARGGSQTFQVTNGDIVTTEVQLTDPQSGGVYAEVESLAPNATRPMLVRLGHGTYQFRCYPEDNDAVNGPAERVTTGPAVGSAAVRPVSNQDLVGVVKTYSAYVATGLGTLAGKAATLHTTLVHGTRGRAEAAWLDANLTYNRLGAAYDTFGDSGDAIDGLPDGLPGGVRDPDFTGLRRIEYGLWHGESLPSLAARAAQLQTDIARLRKHWPTDQIDPNDLPLRAHEILENALQFELTGNADEGSGTSLATALANVDGTQHVLDALEPVMSTRYTAWPTLPGYMATARAAISAARRPDGSWTPVGDLPTAARQRIDAAVGGLLEALAPIAAIGDVRREQ